MDFRTVSPADIAWRRGGRQGGALAGLTDGRRVVVQSPWCSCSVGVHSPGMFRVDATLFRSDPVHAEFAEWIAAIEDSADGSWQDGKRMSSSVFNGNFRMMLFSDTLVFDEAGALSADVVTAKKCSAILELTGAWVKGDRWGLRWKVVQLKYSRDPLPRPAEFVSDDDDDEGIAFVDDDDDD
jgi:hypothetical protein